jgi:hypothetical protein
MLKVLFAISLIANLNLFGGQVSPTPKKSSTSSGAFSHGQSLSHHCLMTHHASTAFPAMSPRYFSVLSF